MAYDLTFSKQDVKNLERINEPFYSSIKQSILALTKDPRPQGYKKLKGCPGYRGKNAMNLFKNH